MDRRDFLKSLVSLPTIIRNAKATDEPKLQTNPKQNIIKLTYMPPCGETPGCILVRSPSNENIADIDIKSSAVENLPNDIQEIIKNLQQQYPHSKFIFKKSTMDYNRDEYDQLAETTLENLLKPSGRSRREYGESISKPS